MTRATRALRVRSYTKLLAAGSLLAVGAAASGCNAFDAPTTIDLSQVPRTIRVVPTDDRPVVAAEVAPPPVSGGNLLMLGSRSYLLTDPARDRITVTTGEDVSSVALPRGSQPERATLDSAGIAHIVLRGTGSILAFDPTAGTVLNEHKVCSAPRGIAYDKGRDRLLIACAEGRLLFHSAATSNYETTTVLPIETDVRDVVAEGDRIYVSRFRSAEVLILTSSGSLLSKSRSPNVVSAFDGRELAPAVAWRMVADPTEDGVLVLHQRAVTAPLVVDASKDGSGTSAISPGESSESSPYGGGFIGSCSTIVQTAITRVSGDGRVSTSASLDGSVLAVDLAVDRDPNTGSLRYILSSAGVKDPELPAITFETVGNTGNDTVVPSTAVGPAPAGFFAAGMPQLLNLTEIGSEQQAPVAVGCEFANTLVDGPSTSVALDGDVTVFAQLEQSRLRRFDSLGTSVEFTALQVGGESIADTGHAIFHRDTGNGIACASCHPEGTDDGRVWQFDDVGARRTQTLAVSIAETAPFHWDGSLPTLGSLMDEVFVERMGGVFESEGRLKSLENWMKRPTHQAFEVDDADGVARGQALFESSEVGCAKCHNGKALTDNQAYDVGTALQGEKLQVPALAGLILHPPYMHNGCAATLLDRFNPSCGGGDAHGKTSHLSSAQINDLVTYLSSL